MACSVHFEVVPIIQSAGTGSATSAAAIAGMGLGLAVTAVVVYVAVKQLQRDYKATMEEFENRQAAHSLIRSEFMQQYAAAANAAASLAELSLSVAQQDAARAFMLQQLAQFAKQVSRYPSPDVPDMVAACQTLQQSIADNSEDVAAFLVEYSKLAGMVATQLAKAIASAPSSTAQAVCIEEIGQLREELDAFFSEKSHTTFRDEMTAHLVQLEQLAGNQAKVAEQGIMLLRERLHRKLQLEVERQDQREKERAEHRRMVHDILARLYAVSAQTLLPDYAQRASNMLALVNSTLVGNATLEKLPDLAHDAVQLYDDCTRLLEEQANRTFLQEQLAEVILTSGLSLRRPMADTITSEQSIVAAISSSLGIAFHFDVANRIRAEVVAFSEESAEVMPDTIEQGIATADAIIKMLSDRQCQVKERFRHLHKHPEGHRLRIVQVAGQDERAAFTNAIAAPRQMRADNR
ncbi:MAG: hypothetical protein WCJ56_01090 [bacterium]